MWEKYKTKDLYIAAYLKAVGYVCQIQTEGSISYFIFDGSAKAEVGNVIGDTLKDHHNVNAAMLINEIKQLKAYVISA